MVRATIDPARIAELEANPNMVKVWTRIGRFLTHPRISECFVATTSRATMKGITMTTRTQEQILADLVANTGRAAQLRRKLAANQSRNWLLALVLHSFGRFAENAKLSDLEAGIINGLQAERL